MEKISIFIALSALFDSSYLATLVAYVCALFCDPVSSSDCTLSMKRGLAAFGRNRSWPINVTILKGTE